MKRFILLVILFALATLPANAQLFKGRHFRKVDGITDTVPGAKRMLEVINKVQGTYVDVPNTSKIADDAIRQMLSSLDPHSIYVPAAEVKRTNESLLGNFDGVGITFSVFNDTVCVSEVLAGGPSEKVGLHPGDKIVRIDGISATGDSATTSFVFRHLRGKKGTVVVLNVLRHNENLTFYIVRDKIPINSVETYFMEPDSIGYISLLRFARTSVSEFRTALNALKKQGMTSLILDLRGNGGGYLDIAVGMANEFLPKGRLIVYQEGRCVKRADFHANRYGSFHTGDLVVLIDENSASASEIVSGAIQDWDRGLLIGRRTFGKGLVQTMFPLSDGGQIRLTTARYYTPSGRCIQRPYDKGTKDYYNDFAKRYRHGEFFTADSIHFPDSLQYHTHGGRTVYGGGGIMPDIFVPMDTTPSSRYYRQCRSKGVISQFPQYWVDHYGNDLRVTTFDTFLLCYDSLGIQAAFDTFAASHGVVRDSLVETISDSLVRFNDNFLYLQVQGLLADRLFGRGHYYRIMKNQDRFYQTALAQLRDKRRHDKQ